MTVNLGPGSNAFIGTAADETVNGEAGNDSLNGQDGNDVLDGGADNDSVNGGNGNDVLSGAAGLDTLIGEAGNDTVIGGADNDSLLGGGGSDAILGGAGQDVISGDDGNDLILGDAGTDTLTGGNGDDALRGGDGADTLDGGAGNDRVSVDGQDAGAEGGDGGIDTLVVLDNAGALTSIDLGNATNQNATGAGPVVRGFEAVDASLASAGVSISGAALAAGTVLLGSTLADTLTGGAAADILFGNAGADAISGGSANDTLFGSLGNDSIDGGNGTLDVAGYGGNAADYQVQQNGAAVTVTDLNPTDGDDGVDQLSGIELLQFADGTVSVGGGQGGNLAPTDIGLSANSAVENAGGLVVGTLTTVDPNAGDNHTYSIRPGGNGGQFTIVGNQLRTGPGGLDFEAGATRSVTIRTTDQGGLFFDETFIINVTNANEAPDASNATFAIPENSANGTVVGVVAASDPDAGSALTFVITNGNTNGAFAVNPTSGQITVANTAALNREFIPAFTLSVQATDQGSLSDTATVIVNLTDVNEAPTANDATFTIAENAAPTTFVGNVAAVDPDAGDTLTYAITGGNTGNAFTINPTSGAITVNNSGPLDADINPVFSLIVSVTDSGSLTDTATVIVNFPAVSGPPSLGDSTFSIAENLANGTLVGPTLTATDPDGGSIIFAIIGGNTNGAFSIEPASTTTARLRVANSAAVDFETNPVFTLQLRVTDSDALTDTATVVINLTNVNEAPTAVTFTNTTTAIDENTDTSAGVKVADIVVTDDALGAETLALTGTDAGSFEIVGTELRLKADVLDFETKTSYSVQVTANDLTVGGNPDATSAIFTVNVNNLPDGGGNTPPAAAADTLIVSSSTAASFPEANLLANDSDPDSDPLDITAVSGATNVTSLGLAGDNVNFTSNAALDGSFNYTLSDGTDTVSGSVTVTLRSTTAGGDTVTGAASGQFSFIDGKAGNDSLTGAAGTDRLFGGDDSDTLGGGAGNDTLDGGNGIDLLNLAAATGAITLTVVQSGSNTTVSISGLGNETYVNMEGVIGGASADSLTGSGSADSIAGGGGNDTITGNAGADTIAGDAGTDSIDGGDEADVIDGGVEGDVLLGGNGNDTITGGNDNDSITGGNGDDNVDAGAGNDTVVGAPGLGSDTYVGGIGTADTLDYSGATNGIVVDLFGGAVLGTDIDTDTISGFEIFIGGPGSDSFIGDTVAAADTFIGGGAGDLMDGEAGDDLLDGGDGDDIIVGNTGNDSILGGNDNDGLTGDSGNDTIAGGNGNDTINPGGDNDSVDGGNGTDLFDLSGASTGISITFSQGAGPFSTGDLSAAGLGTDSYANMEGLFTGGGNDSITGSGSGDFISSFGGDDTIDGAGGADSLDGGDEADSLLGGASNDTLDGGNGNDIISGGGGNDVIDGGLNTDLLDFSDASAGITLTLVQGAGPNSTGDLSAAGLGTDSYANMEGVIGGGSADSITGSASPDSLFGGGGNDTINGAAGDDTILGQDGNDSLIGGTGTIADIIDGGNGADTIRGGDGDDTVDGGNGTDLLDLSDASAGVTFTLSQGAGPFSTGDLSAAGLGTDSYSNMEGVIGGTGADSLTGSSSADTTFGGGANDTIDGAAGADSISGEDGDDSLVGGSGTAADTISGGNGDDVVTGGSGDDLIDGGNGNDNIQGNSDNDSIAGGTGNDSIQGQAGNDTIDGGAGNDTIRPGDGTDSVTGGANNDLFRWETTSTFGDVVTDLDAGTSGTTVDRLQFDTAGISLGNGNMTVENFASGNDATINVAGTEVGVKTDAGVATASIQTTIDGYTNITTGTVFVFFDTTLSNAVVYYDSNPNSAGGATLVAEFDNITTLGDLANFNSTDFVFG